MKIRRLAVSGEYSGKGLGSEILELVKYTLITNPLAGCRSLTVDAYSQATDFYKKNGFKYFTLLDTLDSTRLMFFDLKSIK